MSVPDVADAAAHWPFLPTLVRLALALGTGAFVGLEREHRGKGGARTFTFASLIGCLGALLGNSFALLAIVLIGLFVCFLNFREWKLHQNLLLTTSAALIIVGFCGVLCGKGHTFTPVATSVITAALLAWKQPITGFATGLSDIELRSAVLLAILSFIVYPVLPAHPVDAYGLVNLQESWATVLLIAALGFVNYVLWKIYGPRSIDITSFLGGLVNSTAAVAELSSRVREAGEGFAKLAYRGVILATGAMLLRNSLILAILALQAFTYSLVPMLLMLATTAVLLRVGAGTAVGTASDTPPDLKLELPFSLKAALKFGLIFLGLSVAGILAQRTLGVFGFYAISIAGGLLSSASAVAAAGTAAAHHEVSFSVAANGAVLASLTSVLINIPLISRTGQQPRLTHALARALLIVVALGVVGVLVHKPFETGLKLLLTPRHAAAPHTHPLAR
jgi:uncharacterized membrane protein (DUF4010 family)